MADQKISDFTEVLSLADNSYFTVVIEGSPNVNRKVQRQNTGLARSQDLADHEADTANPHATTYTQVGADAAGSAAAVQSSLNSHTGDGTIHFTVASLGLGTAAFTDATAYLAAGAKLDDLAAPDDNTDLNATTSAHGLAPKAVAPAAGNLAVLGIANSETAYTNKVILEGALKLAVVAALPGTPDSTTLYFVTG